MVYYQSPDGVVLGVV